jgi:ankyrin repeat protein
MKTITELLEATRDGKIDQVKQLLSEGVSANATDGHSTTALHYAVRNNRTDIITLLHTHQAKLIRNSWGLRPCDYQNRLISLETMELIRKLYKIEPSRNEFTWSKENIHELLLSKKPDCYTRYHMKNKRDHRGFTPLEYVIYHGCKDLVEPILKLRVDLNSTSIANQTALDVAHAVKDDGSAKLIDYYSQQASIQHVRLAQSANVVSIFKSHSKDAIDSSVQSETLLNIS